MNINYSTQKLTAPSNAVKINPKSDVNYFDTLCLFCADNDIDLSSVDDSEFESLVNELSRFGYDFDGPAKEFWFWVN